jgi:type IV pilus assembly protein PilQ
VFGVLGLLVGSAGGQNETSGEQTTGTAQVTGTETFEIHVQGADLRGVLQLLSTQGKKNIVATQEVTGEVTADLYGVSFEEALDAVMRSTGFVYEQKGNFVYVYTPEQYKAIKEAERKLEVLVYHLAYLTAADAQVLIAPALSKKGQVAVTPAAATGIAQSDTEAGGDGYATGDMLVVQDYEENIKHVKEILDKLDVKPEQVLIEATILRATLDEDNDLGIDFESLGALDFSALDTRVDIDNTVSGSVPTGGLTLGITTNQIDFFIRALESVTDVTVMANPKLLVVNKQRGEIMIGNRDGYITTTITETAATETVQFLETGTRLLVRPYIGRDGWIRMDIHPEDSSGQVETVGTQALPSETTTETTSNIMVRDGHTIVIGGLFRERIANGRSQLPLLGNIPYLGTMFRSTSDAIDREEVIILVTPHIVRADVDEPASDQLLDEANRQLIGQRKGLQWFGRERLSHSHMRKAKRALAGGDRAEALWNLDMALSLEPRLPEAISMKERLTESAYWSEESRITTARYIIQKLIMQELGKPFERIVMPKKPRNAEGLDEDVKQTLGIGVCYEDPLPGPVQQPQQEVQEVEPENPDNENSDTVPGETSMTEEEIAAELASATPLDAVTVEASETTQEEVSEIAAPEPEQPETVQPESETGETVQPEAETGETVQPEAETADPEQSETADAEADETIEQAASSDERPDFIEFAETYVASEE